MDDLADHASDGYVPGSLLLDPRPFTRRFDALDYVLDEYYTGTGRDGLARLAGFDFFRMTGFLYAPDMDRRIEARGFREKLDRLDLGEEPNCEYGLRLTSAFLCADMTWNAAYTWEFAELEEYERLIAGVKVGDALSVLVTGSAASTRPSSTRRARCCPSRPATTTIFASSRGSCSLPRAGGTSPAWSGR